MMPVQGTAKKSSPLLYQSQVSSSQKGFSSFDLGNRRLSSTKKNRNLREICKEQSVQFPYRETRLVVWRQQAKNSTTKDVSLGEPKVNMDDKSCKTLLHANLVC